MKNKNEFLVDDDDVMKKIEAATPRELDEFAKQLSKALNLMDEVFKINNIPIPTILTALQKYYLAILKENGCSYKYYKDSIDFISSEYKEIYED